MILTNPSRFFRLLRAAQSRYDWPRRTSGNTDLGGTMPHKAAKKVWFITGAGRGMGVDFAKAALAAGHTVVATGRDTDAVAKAVGKSEGLLIVKLDVTNRANAEAAAVTYAEPSIEDYADRTAEQLKWWQAQSGQQGGDPAKLARALVAIASEEPPPRRFIGGADAIGLAEQKIADLQAQIAAYRDLSTSLAFDMASLNEPA